MPRAARSVRSRPARVVPRRQPAASAMRTLARRKISAARTSAASNNSYWSNVKRRWAEGGGPNKPYYQAAGSLIGGTAGSVAGGLVNRGLYALTGYGDYKVRANSLLETNGPPSVVNRGNKEFVVRHREYITDVFSLSGAANTPSAFGVTSYSINPGNVATFPWLSTIADKFEQYRIEGMVFEFKSLYSDAVVTQNGSIGSIVLATEYNAGTPSFATKQQMENYQFAQSCKPSCSVLHPIECARPQNVLSELYIRPGAVPPNEDVKTYDFGDFQIASQGIPLGAAGAAVNLGELWVSYQISLIKPKIPTGYIDSGYAHFYTPSASTGIITTPTPAPLSLISKSAASNLNITQATDNVFRVTLGTAAMTLQFVAIWSSYPIADSTPRVAWRAPSYSHPGASAVFAIPPTPNSALGAPWTSAFTGTGCMSEVFIRFPAATPSVGYIDVTIGNNGTYDQAVPNIFNLHINRVPDNVTSL